MDKKHFGFLGLIVGSHFNAAGGYAMGGIMDWWKFLDY